MLSFSLSCYSPGVLAIILKSWFHFAGCKPGGFLINELSGHNFLKWAVSNVCVKHGMQECIAKVMYLKGILSLFWFHQWTFSHYLDQIGFLCVVWAWWHCLLLLFILAVLIKNRQSSFSPLYKVGRIHLCWSYTRLNWALLFHRKCADRCRKHFCLFVFQKKAWLMQHFI